MRYYKYIDLEGEYTVSEKDIIDTYFPYWSNLMKKVGKESEISKEQCIEDWKIVYWAWEIK